MEKQELWRSPVRGILGTGALFPAPWEEEEDDNLLALTNTSNYVVSLGFLFAICSRRLGVMLSDM